MEPKEQKVIETVDAVLPDEFAVKIQDATANETRIINACTGNDD